MLADGLAGNGFQIGTGNAGDLADDLTGLWIKVRETPNQSFQSGATKLQVFVLHEDFVTGGLFLCHVH
ncbi:MAG: hypothetical protein R3E89_18615 [Thiolinea sp.]